MKKRRPIKYAGRGISYHWVDECCDSKDVVHREGVEVHSFCLAELVNSLARKLYGHDMAYFPDVKESKEKT